MHLQWQFAVELLHDPSLVWEAFQKASTLSGPHPPSPWPSLTLCFNCQALRDGIFTSPPSAYKGIPLLVDDISKFHFTSDGSRLQIRDVPKSRFFNFLAKPAFNNICPLNFPQEQYSSTMSPVFIFFGAISI